MNVTEWEAGVPRPSRNWDDVVDDEGDAPPQRARVSLQLGREAELLLVAEGECACHYARCRFEVTEEVGRVGEEGRVYWVAGGRAALLLLPEPLSSLVCNQVARELLAASARVVLMTERVLSLFRGEGAEDGALFVASTRAPPTGHALLPPPNMVDGLSAALLSLGVCQDRSVSVYVALRDYSVTSTNLAVYERVLEALDLEGSVPKGAFKAVLQNMRVNSGSTLFL